VSVFTASILRLARFYLHDAALRSECTIDLAIDEGEGTRHEAGGEGERQGPRPKELRKWPRDRCADPTRLRAGQIRDRATKQAGKSAARDYGFVIVRPLTIPSVLCAKRTP
jgi:hypothetical protein